MNSCIACGERATEVHHVKTRGSGGPDLPHNRFPICRLCHTRWGMIGNKAFIKESFQTKCWLERHGWDLSGDKIFHPLNSQKVGEFKKR